MDANERNDCSDIIRVVASTRLDKSGAKQRLKKKPRKNEDSQLNLAEAMRRYVEPFGGIDLKLPKREPIRKPPSFD